MKASERLLNWLGFVSPCGHPLRDLVLVADGRARVTQCLGCLTSPTAQEALRRRVAAEATMRKAAGAQAGESTADAVVRLAGDGAADPYYVCRCDDVIPPGETCQECGGSAPAAPTRLTPERIEEARKRAAAGAVDLEISLRGMFGE